MQINNKKKKLFIGLIFFFCIISFFLSFNKIANAQGPEVWGEGEAVKTAIEETGLEETDPSLIIARVIKIFLGFLGLIALILIMYAGYLWMTAGGDETKIGQAKAILKNAVIGLVIILSSYAIVSFIFNRLGVGDGTRQAGISGPGSSPFFGALGENIIESHYPARNEKDIPRNTKIIITFREEMNVDSIIINKQENAACGTDGMTCGQINFNNIRIYPAAEGDSCRLEQGQYVDCELNNIVDVDVATLDMENFVFRPKDYLGNSTNSVKYTVYLGSGTQKIDGDGAFGVGGNYEWSFDVSNVLDFSPPNVKNIFPFPDNEADNYNITEATAAEWNLNINSLPSAGESAKATIVPLGASTGNVEISGIYSGQDDGTFRIVIIDQEEASVSFSGGENIEKTIINNSISLGYNLTFKINDSFSAGNSWDINLISQKEADVISIDYKKYVFAEDITMADTTGGLAVNIETAINKDEESPLTAQASGDQVILKAKIAGESANSLNINSSSIGIVVTQTVQGSDRNVQPQTRGIQDQPINSIIQINFNEAVDPLAANNFITITDSNEIGIQGEFLFSNQYKTIEFRPDNPCGMNACGETIYCLPERENIKIVIKAGELESICTSKLDCTDYPYCRTSGNINVCQNDENKNFPVAKFNSGIVDMSDNSLDGNSNDNAEGPQNQSGRIPYSMNNPQKDSQGDDYQWTFYTSNLLDLTAPEIILRRPSQNENNVALDDPLEAQFDKLMMSSSLKTGAVEIEGKQHNRIGLEAINSNPVGYWVEKENVDVPQKDGYPDQTMLIIQHDDFEEEINYRGDIGSGVKDIYQNCYNPSTGPCADNPNELCVNCGAGEDCNQRK